MRYTRLHWAIEESDPRARIDNPDAEYEEEILFECPTVLSPENAVVLTHLQSYIYDLLQAFKKEQEEFEPNPATADKLPSAPVIEKALAKEPAAPTPNPVKIPPGGVSTGDGKKRALDLLRKGFTVGEAYDRICKERETAGLPLFSKANLYLWRKELQTTTAPTPATPPSPKPTPEPAPPVEHFAQTVNGHECLRPNISTISERSCLGWQWRWRNGNAKPADAMEHLKICGGCSSYIKSFDALKLAHEAATRKRS